ncbi:MAG TPA: ABC transporter permease [Candidatus Limnocylindrales bacterium]|nr:ABC transporter permease [Candidatus Limnocylindrales bacterium]
MTVFMTLASVTLRSLLGRRRTLLMLLLAAMPVLLGLIVRANDGDVEAIGATLDGFVVRIVLPLIALVFGTAALGAELDDGTAVHILTKPIDRWAIVLTKLLVAGTLTAAMVVPSTILGGLLMGGDNPATTGVTFAFALATFLGSYVYVAIFLALSVATSRGLIIGLAYALIWEGLLGGLLPGTQILSVREYIGGIAGALDSRAVADSAVGAAGLLYAVVAFVVAAVLGSARLARYEVRGAE